MTHTGSFKSYCFVTNLSFASEPTVRNRLIPYIEQALMLGLEVTLVSADSEKLDIFHPSFQHILHPVVKRDQRSFVKRSFFEWREVNNILGVLSNLKVDVFVVTIPSMFFVLNTSFFKKNRVVLDVRDLTWEYLSSQNIIYYLAKSIFRVLVGRSLKHLKSIVVTNDTEFKYFLDRGVKALIYPNGMTKRQLLDMRGIPDESCEEFIVAYIGKVGIAQDLSTLILAARSLRGIQFLIAGFGSEYEKMEELAKEHQVDNVSFHGRVDWDGVLEIYGKSNVLYSQLTSDFSGAMPSKLYQYISAKRFVIYGGEGQAKEILSNFSNNIVIPPQNVDKLVEAILLAKSATHKALDYEKNIKIINDRYVRDGNANKILHKLSLS